MKIYGNLALYLLLALLPMLAYAVPQSINYQGVYRESGVPVTGSRAMTFRITDSGGSVEYWTSGEIDVDVSMGVFRAGLQVPASVDWGSITPFLEVSVGTTTLLPRDPLTSTAYAFFASTAQALVPGSLKDSHVSPSAAIDPSKIAGTAMTLTQTETVSGAKTFNADLIMGSGQIIAAPGQSGITIATSVVINTSGSPGELRMMNSDIRLVSYGARILFADGTFADSGGATFSSTTATGLGNNINADILADADQNNSGVIRLQTGPSTRLMIRNDGKIGIGTDIPLSRLSVLGNVAIGDYAGDPGSAPAAAPPYGLIVSGNVGIGMPNPTTALDVNGTITALAFSGKATSAGAATNIAGGLANEIPYQTGAGATTFTGQPGANAVLFANSGAPVWMNAPTLTGTNFSGIPDTALSSNVDLLNTAKTLSAVKTFTAAPVITTITANGAFSISTAASVGAIQMPNLYVAASGNVGVGTAGADQKLTVAGNVSQTGVIISSGAGSNYFAGSVGIGTTTPTVALDVNGGVRVGNYVSASTPSPVGIAGTFIFNTTIGKPYVSNGTVWKPLDSDFDSDGITDAIDVDDNNAADATAAPSEVLAGRTFYSGGAARTGTMATQTLDPANDTVLAGYYAATTLSAVDADLAAGNIAVSTTIFGKAGAYIGNNLPDTGQT
ncbi:MAG: hypothetical protein KKH28_11140, partial [Elusimicrobia bacterium]|nr:hypothetical protein [Elusimicrobiota bacterium]